jgi:hypothetical protein
MKKFHLALSVKDIDASVAEYSKRLGCKPQLIVPKTYALWRTETLNVSIRVVDQDAGMLRHLGWEDSEAKEFTSATDCNGILWENFNAQNQQDEIERAWPGARKS